jgi:hypothetical protein
MIDIVCLKWGDKFGAEYVNNLFSGIERNTTVPFKFHCFTDDDTDVLENIQCHALPELDITGWWYKLWLFSDEMPFESDDLIMFFDLDTIVTGNIDDILEYDCPENLTGIRNFYNPDRFASGLLMWRHGTQTHIWREFLTEPRKAQAQSPDGDQQWTESQAKSWTHFQDEFQGVYSYKQSCSNGLPADAKIVCYHGTPSVIQSFTETVENWDSKNRNGGVPYHPQTWVKTHWRTHMEKQFWKGQWTGGYPETVSGGGSTMANTQGIRKVLPEVIEKYNIKTLFDAPTGDRNWIKTIDFDSLGCEYSGGEYVADIVADINLPSVTQFDVRSDTPPDVDLWLCRDLLFHFSDADVDATLENMVDNSNIKYLLVTSHDVSARHNSLNKSIQTGDFRALVLEDEGWLGLGEPLEVFDDPSDSPIEKIVLLFDLDKARSDS